MSRGGKRGDHGANRGFSRIEVRSAQAGGHDHAIEDGHDLTLAADRATRTRPVIGWWTRSDFGRQLFEQSARIRDRHEHPVDWQLRDWCRTALEEIARRSWRACHVERRVGQVELGDEPATGHRSRTCDGCPGGRVCDAQPSKLLGHGRQRRCRRTRREGKYRDENGDLSHRAHELDETPRSNRLVTMASGHLGISSPTLGQREVIRP